MAANRYDAPFFKPPEVNTSYPHPIESGQIVLYVANDWNSQSLTIDTNSSQYPPGHPFVFSGAPGFRNTVSWIAFNLPAGTVCTLVQNAMVSPPPPSESAPAWNPYNFARAGICVDLIGNGQVQTVDLGVYGANDLLSGGIWRQVDVTRGWFQLFEQFDCGGRFNTIFLADWKTNDWHPLTDWQLNKVASSVNYPCLTPPQLVTLSEDLKGRSQSITLNATNCFGTWANKATMNFSEQGLDDRIQAFAYELLLPVKAEIEAVEREYSAKIEQTLSQDINTENRSTAPIQYSVLLAQENTRTVAVKATLAYSMAMGVVLETAVKFGVAGLGQVTGKITTSFDAKHSSKSSQSYSDTETVSLSRQITFSVPPGVKYRGSASFSTGTVTGLTVETCGRFYYATPLPGSTPVKEGGDTVYQLDSPVIVELSGGVASQVEVVTHQEPITSG